MGSSCSIPRPTSRNKLAGSIEVGEQEIVPATRLTMWQSGALGNPKRFKGLTLMTDSRYNGGRFEDVWLDK